MSNPQTYKYIIKDSIIYNQSDDYELSKKEYHLLYSFFITYSCCGNQSWKKRTFTDYGWNNYARTNYTKEVVNKDKYLKDRLCELINLDDRTHFIFTTDGDIVKDCFKQINLMDGLQDDLSTERAVITKCSEPNKLLKLFYRIRDCFAHGKYVLKINRYNQKMIVFQDDDGSNVTGRIVIKLSTIISMIQIIDKNNLLKWR